MPPESEESDEAAPGRGGWADLLERWTGYAGVAWSILALLTGVMGMREEWSGTGSHSPSLGSALVFLALFPVAAGWVLMTLLGLVAHRRTADRKLHAGAVGTLVFGSVLLLQVPAGSPSDHHALTSRFLASALLTLGSLVGLGVTIWFLRRPRS